ncbi:MAG: ATP-binding protein [Muribaculaceae bacterium]|nr:ATP-binding protein [Muribaculaceae bacterium]
MASNRPQFWLQVRKDYIFDNFDNLLNYLRLYNYTTNEEHPDYDSTLNCMTDLSEEIADKIFSTPFFEDIDTGYDTTAVIRLLCATILASNKAGITPHRVICALVDIVMKSGIEVRDPQLINFYEIVSDCVRQKEMIKCGFTWDDIITPELQCGLFIVKFCQMSFRALPESQSAAYIENRGLLVIPREGISDLAVVNRVNYEKMKPEVQFTLPGMIQVLVSKREHEKAGDFERLYQLTSRLLAAQDQMTPSTRRVFNDYAYEDEFIVKVTNKRGLRIDAETIDPDYRQLSGKVLLRAFDKRPIPGVFSDMIKTGDYLKVYISDEPGYAFEITDSFENFYRQYVASNAGMKRLARYTSSYANGTEWTTEDGMRVGIDKGKLSGLDPDEMERFEALLETQGMMEVRLYARPPRMDLDTFYVYAEISDLDADEGDPESRFTFSDADRVLVEKFLEECSEEGHEVEEKGRCLQFEAADRELCIPLVSVMARVIEGGLSSCRSRLEHITATAMLCKVLDLKKELAYMEHERRYLYAQVQFAQNRPLPPLSHESCLDGSADVARREKIIDTLRSYRKKEVATGNGELKLKREGVASQVSALVTASNSLIDIIDALELNNIKQAIARALSIEDEYVSILDERTFYGMESISLEFKSSVVFPPTNRRLHASTIADPEMQKWAIIKAVCGFLNSRSGGELLLGVGDDGYARGLDDDMRMLAELRQISSPTLDHYRTYVQYILDHAFCEPNPKVSSTDISRLCIKYVPEENAEGKKIMRIQILPYKGAMVTVTPERPQWMEAAYVRLSGRTVPVTSAMTAEIMNYKKTML